MMEYYLVLLWLKIRFEVSRNLVKHVGVTLMTVYQVVEYK